MNACFHVIKKDAGGLLGLLEDLLALLWGWCEERSMQSSRNYVRASLGVSPLRFLFLAKVWGCACQSGDAICVAQPARLLQNCTRINLKSHC